MVNLAPFVGIIVGIACAVLIFTIAIMVASPIGIFPGEIQMVNLSNMLISGIAVFGLSIAIYWFMSMGE